MSRSGVGLSPDERDRLAAIRSAESLTELVEITGAETEHDAYVAAKAEWADLREKQLAATPVPEGLPGTCVVVDGTEFHVHGVTHADTTEERAFLREHVSRLLDAGATVYCEQGIRPMYFDDFDGVRTMDDYRWAMERCRTLDADSRVADLEPFDGLAEQVDALAARFRAAAVELVDTHAGRYGEAFERALGDVASGFLTTHEEMATGEDVTSSRLRRAAAHDPGRLVELQRHYETTFLPQPLEREWLRRHDPELELLTHARNERMADYAVYQHDDAPAVHLVVGAAHQPGVTYYLERHRDGDRSVEGFAPVA